MFSLFKKKPFFTADENQRIVTAIRSCENRTSGEIRVYCESRNPMVEPLDRALEIFTKLKMHLTLNRNAVLLYIAVKDKEVALYGDAGIYERLGTEFWDREVKHMLRFFKKGDLTSGIVDCVLHVGETLAEKFPYSSSEDKNELPDDIVFGR